MGAEALGSYLAKRFPDKKYFYITSDYTWGWSTEESLRKFTNTENTASHKRVLTPLGTTDFKKPLKIAKASNADVLVLVLFGRDMQNGIRQATVMGLKKKMQIVVPIIELSMAEGAGPKIMEDVIGTSDFNWQVPYKYKYQKGIDFVEKFLARFDRYPCWGAATAYTNMLQYRDAVERAGSFDTAKVIKALEGHKFSLLKNEQEWREFDHQNVQDVYLVKCKPASKVVRDKLGLDFYEILDRTPGSQAVQTREEWDAVRKANGLPTHLEPL
jgi:ABC-type branched-subunit amino acid transport system substrate-binding protein